MRRRYSKKKNLTSFIIVLFLCVGLGYALLSSTLNINGTAKIMDATWDIHFTNLRVTSGSVTMGSEDSAASINSSDNTQITYIITFKEPGEFYEFTVDAKNFGSIDGMIESVSSKLGGVEIGSTNPLPVYLNYSATYSDDIPIDENHLLTAGSKVTYKVRLEYKKDIEITDLPSSPQTYSFSFEVTSIQADETAIVKPEWPVIQVLGYNDRRAFKSDTYREKIKIINLDDEINPPSNPIESWDIGVAQNGNVMAYIIENEDDNTMYDLYIQGDGALYANPDSRNLFRQLTGVDSIHNIEVLDTSKVTDMSDMFSQTGYNSTVFTLDLGNNFDTSNVTNMFGMFSTTGYNSTAFTLNLGNKFDTSKVTNMGCMFNYTGYRSTVFTLDLGDMFNTKKAINMSSMFNYTGYSSPVFTLNLGNKFDTSSAVSMVEVFARTGYSSTVFTLNLGDKFDTSNVTDMLSMFWETGYSSPIFTLNLGNKFDTSKVTNMVQMFTRVGYNSPVFTLNLGDKFDTSNVTDMNNMFNRAGYSNSNFTLDLGDKFNIDSATDITYMFYQTGNANNNFELHIPLFDFSNVTSYDTAFGTSFGSRKLYVKDVTAQNWIIDKFYYYGADTNNILIEGA